MATRRHNEGLHSRDNNDENVHVNCITENVRVCFVTVCVLLMMALQQTNQ